jgi:hypothetical protein
LSIENWLFFIEEMGVPVAQQPLPGELSGYLKTKLLALYNIALAGKRVLRGWRGVS